MKRKVKQNNCINLFFWVLVLVFLKLVRRLRMIGIRMRSSVRIVVGKILVRVFVIVLIVLLFLRNLSQGCFLMSLLSWLSVVDRDIGIVQRMIIVVMMMNMILFCSYFCYYLNVMLFQMMLWGEILLIFGVICCGIWCMMF